MILEWPKRSATTTEKLLGIIFDAGMTTRADLMLITGWNYRRLSRCLQRVRSMKQDMIRKFSSPEGLACYALGEDGVRFMHQLLGIQSRIVTMEAQMNHALGLNAVLMRYLKSNGRSNVNWYSTREATDELHFLRSSRGESDAHILSTQIRPDALLRCPQGMFWIEYDNSTEGSRKLLEKYRLYITNLERLSDRSRHVIWVTKSENRCRWMKQLWSRMAVEAIRMDFFVEGAEFEAWRT